MVYSDEIYDEMSRSIVFFFCDTSICIPINHYLTPDIQALVVIHYVVY
jgi:hypothetical protein